MDNRFVPLKEAVEIALRHGIQYREKLLLVLTESGIGIGIGIDQYQVPRIGIGIDQYQVTGIGIYQNQVLGVLNRLRSL